MHGVQRVGLVVVSPLMVAHVNRDRRVEGGEDVVRGCESTEGDRVRRVREGERTSKKKLLDFHTKKENFKEKGGGYNTATGVSQPAEHFGATYWHYHTREVE